MDPSMAASQGSSSWKQPRAEPLDLRDAREQREGRPCLEARRELGDNTKGLTASRSVSLRAKETRQDKRPLDALEARLERGDKSMRLTTERREDCRLEAGERPIGLGNSSTKSES